MYGLVDHGVWKSKRKEGAPERHTKEDIKEAAKKLRETAEKESDKCDICGRKVGKIGYIVGTDPERK